MRGPAFGSHGYVFTYDVPDPTLAARLAARLSTLRLADTAPPDAAVYRITPEPSGWLALWHDAERIDSRMDFDTVTLLLHWHVNQQVIARAAAARTTLHAAAAASPAGAGVLLAAPMEAGKTTTVTGLLRHGFDFLSDEAVAVDPDGTMWAYPKPLTIDYGSWPLFPELAPNDLTGPVTSWLVPATRTGARVVESAPLRLIVFPAYQEGGVTTATPIGPAEAALGLARSTFEFDRRGARDLRTVSALARSCPAYRLDIGDLGAAVDLVDSLLATAVAA